MSEQLFSRENQFDIGEALMYRLKPDGSEPNEKLDIRAMIEEHDFFEDILSPFMSGQMLISDSFNLPDSFPIVGGERISIRFKTSSFNSDVRIKYVVYKVGERIVGEDLSKAQLYWLYLCPEDKWNDSQTDVSFGITSTYDGVANRALDLLKSTKKRDFEPTLGVVSFVSPYWSPLRCCEFAASRARTDIGDPMFFWETVDQYSLKSLTSLYKQEPIKRIFIEPKGTRSILEHGDKLFDTVTSWSYQESDNRLKQNVEGAFGTDVYYLDPQNWNITRRELTSDDIESVKIEKYSLSDSPSKNRSKTTSIIEKSDQSDQIKAKRDAILDRIDNKRLIVELPGDSKVRAGQTILLDIPSPVANASYAKERTSSGKWLIVSVRHITIRDRYKMNLELVKDSTETKVI